MPHVTGDLAMKKLLSLMSVVGLLGLLVATSGEVQKPPPTKGHEFMLRKLDHSQRVLEGIVLEDFDLIEKYARTLSMLSLAAEWQVSPSAEYRQHSQEFRRTADALAEMARKKNLDGAALKYVELTLNCVNCHKEVRKTHVDDRKRPVAGDEVTAAIGPTGSDTTSHVW